MKNGRCNTHDCVIKKVVTRKKVWCWIEKKKEYGYKNTQKTKLLCVGKFGTDSAICKTESYGELVGGIQAAGRVNMNISSATLGIRKESESSECSNQMKAS